MLWVVPATTHAVGDTGHTADHNAMAGDLDLIVQALPAVEGGLAGATAATRFAGGTVTGHPVSGVFAVGDFVIDQSGNVWICTTAGSPGTWTLAGTGGGGVMTNPMTTPGDMITAGTGGSPQRLPVGSNGQALIVSSGAPAWGAAGFAGGGTGQSTQQAALDAIAGGVNSGQFLRGNGTHVVLAAIQASDVPQLADYAPTGLTGAAQAARFVGGTTSGAPVSGTFAVGDFVIDHGGVIWACTVAGTQGTWVNVAGTPVTSFNTRTGAVVPGNSDYLAVASGGLAGATAATRYVGGTTSGAPVSGTFAAGDMVVTQDGHVFVCTAAGTPGTWANAGASAGVSTFNSRSGAVVPGNADYLAVASGGLTGATAATRYAGGTTSGAPSSGTFAVGDFIVDQTGRIFICTTAGTPGTWTNAGSLYALLSGATFTGAIIPAVVTLTFVASGTTLVNAALGNDFRLTLTASTTTIGNPSNSVDGQRIDFQINVGTGPYTYAWGSNYDFGTAGTPAVSGTASDIDIIGFVYNAAKGKWIFLGAALGN
jgi:hypothetical protein